MNQSITFPDQKSWLDQESAICFPAQQAGYLINCVITAEALVRVTDQLVADNDSIETKSSDALAQRMLALFELYRFDIEALAEQVIDDEQFDKQGRAILR